MFFLADVLQIHNSENQQQKMWITNLNIVLDKSENIFQICRQRHFKIRCSCRSEWFINFVLQNENGRFIAG